MSARIARSTHRPVRRDRSHSTMQSPTALSSMCSRRSCSVVTLQQPPLPVATRRRASSSVKRTSARLTLRYSGTLPIRPRASPRSASLALKSTLIRRGVLYLCTWYE